MEKVDHVTNCFEQIAVAVAEVEASVIIADDLNAVRDELEASLAEIRAALQVAHSDNIDVREADAHLIAAAPELLEACITSLGAYDALAASGSQRHLPGYSRCLEDLRAAIFKARGE